MLFIPGVRGIYFNGILQLHQSIQLCILAPKMIFTLNFEHQLNAVKYYAVSMKTLMKNAANRKAVVVQYT